MSDAELCLLLRSRLSADEIARADVLRDRQPLRRGDELFVDRQRISAPFDGILVVIDLAPGYNWAHPCRIVLVREDGAEVQEYPASFPPGGRAPLRDFASILSRGVEVQPTEAR
jgi:hypothetical protein